MSSIVNVGIKALPAEKRLMLRDCPGPGSVSRVSRVLCNAPATWRRQVEQAALLPQVQLCGVQFSLARPPAVF